MATNAFNPVYHHHHLRRRHSIDGGPPFAASSSLSLKPSSSSAGAVACRHSLLTHSTVAAAAVAASSSASTSTSDAEEAAGAVSFDLLRQHLSSKDFRLADDETRRLLIILAGEAAQKRGYVFFSEVQFIAVDDLRAIDELWREHSDGRYGYSVQKRIWEKVNKDFTRFFIRVGWMKKLDASEVEQYNYRSFPSEFMWDWEETPPAPEGHLPLTNALRGTQLLSSILSHPAFDSDKEEEKEGGGGDTSTTAAAEEEKKGTELKGSHKGFKPNYTF